MKQFLGLLLAVALGTGTAAAKGPDSTSASNNERIHGYLVDVMCAQGMVKKQNSAEKAPSHTTECALADNCTASGYGVFSNGTYIKFDKQGNTLAHSLLEKTKTTKGVMVTATGKRTGDELAVTSLKETHMKSMGAGKKESSGASKDHDHTSTQ